MIISKVYGAARDSTNHVAQAETPITTAFADGLLELCRSMASEKTEENRWEETCRERNSGYVHVTEEESVNEIHSIEDKLDVEKKTD